MPDKQEQKKIWSKKQSKNVETKKAQEEMAERF